jgi:NADH-quinone oxidoreductase subunit N
VGALNSILSLYYYLLVLRRMYIQEATLEYPKIRTSIPVKVVLAITLVAIFWFGVLPGTVMRVITEISERLFS